jgi:hypothetical protein
MTWSRVILLEYRNLSRSRMILGIAQIEAQMLLRVEDCHDVAQRKVRLDAKEPRDTPVADHRTPQSG